MEKPAIIRLIYLWAGRSPADEGADDAPTEPLYISLNDVRLLFYSNLSTISFRFIPSRFDDVILLPIIQVNKCRIEKIPIRFLRMSFKF